MSNSLWPYGWQDARPSRPSLSPGVCPSSCPSSQWCHPTISSSAAVFSFCLQSFPASFPVSQLFAAGGQSIGASASASVVLPVNIQVWSPCCPRDSQESSSAPQFKSIHSLALSLLYGPTLTSVHDYWSHHFTAIRRGKSRSSDRFSLLGYQKSLWMVTAALKLEDACLLKGKLWQT